MSHRDWDQSCKVYIGNLGQNGTKHEIEASFTKYGPLKNTWIARNPPGFAFVEFEDPRDAEDAVRGLDGTLVNMIQIKLFQIPIIISLLFLAVFAEFVYVLKCLATDLVVDAMVVVVEEVVTAEVVVEEVVDTIEVLHVTMIGIMTGNILLNNS